MCVYINKLMKDQSGKFNPKFVSDVQHIPTIQRIYRIGYPRERENKELYMTTSLVRWSG